MYMYTYKWVSPAGWRAIPRRLYTAIYLSVTRNKFNSRQLEQKGASAVYYSIYLLHSLLLCTDEEAKQ